MAEFFINTETPDAEYDSFPISMFMDYKEETYDVLSSVFLRKMNEEMPVGEGKVLEHECRFDNLSNTFMGSPDYWWLLMEYNDKIDWEIYSNEHIKIPSPLDMIRLRDTIAVNWNNEFW
jgi:hypothetical protein